MRNRNGQNSQNRYGSAHSRSFKVGRASKHSRNECESMSSEHKPHPMMRRLAVLDGRVLAESAFSGAAYHLREITRILNSASKVAEAWTGDKHPPFLNASE